ncbi:hypothetical protein DOY81_002189 [Sarcophaga bullata]|nr:hypothetical protein DOY81_002189 [Sarcophaga bullata]
MFVNYIYVTLLGVSVKIEPPAEVQVKDSPSLLEQLEIEAEFETNISKILAPDEMKVEIKEEDISFDAQNNNLDFQK